MPRKLQSIAATTPQPFEAPEHRLRMVSAFIDPMWLNTVRGRTYDAAVAPDGTLSVEREVLVFVDPGLAAGTPVRVTVGRHISCVTQSDWARAVTERAAAHTAAEAADAERHAAQQAEAKAFNARLQLPVSWVSAIKDVLSGLSATSWGDGRNRATVNHILLLEDLQTPKLRRKAGDFLCTAARGSNGRRYSVPEVAHTSNSASQYVQKITCRRCLDLAKRWTAE
ncbi:hypothetical protein [Cupriavidus sp. TMH.W2]|uniref:hypothetical protein n=1 Tax=Cupriavidus sp. TMH.W2 TaxID=3434465 RepID=UPI003D76C8BE